MSIRVLIFSSTRADSGILRPLALELDRLSEVELTVCLSGTHFNEELKTASFSDFTGLRPESIVPLPIPGLELRGLEGSLGDGYTVFLEHLREATPDVAIVLGDRVETHMFAFACTIANVPLAHLHGGELTFGALDELHRHSITKMSVLHFSVDVHSAKRIIQMGENPQMVFPFGSPRMDTIQASNSLSLLDLEELLGVKIPESFALVTMHSARHDSPSTRVHQSALLESLRRLRLFAVFTGPNADQGGDLLRKDIGEYLIENPELGVFIENMGERPYLAALRECVVAIGNSSSLILEAPLVGTPTVLIGSRQAGRAKNSEGLGADVDLISDSIQDAINRGKSSLTLEFGGSVSRLIAEQIVKSHPLNTRKVFHETPS